MCDNGVSVGVGGGISHQNRETSKGAQTGRSPFSLLFVIVIEYLSRLVKMAVDNKQLDLYKSGGIAVESHFVYADDVIFFCRASTKALTALKEILNEFIAFSGLQINAGKSSIIFSKRVADSAQLAAILGFQINELPIRYLGTPLTEKLIRYRD